MKTCVECKQAKPLDEFHARSAAKDGKQNKCKKCNIESRLTYYRTDKGKQSNKAAQAKTQSRNRGLLIEYLKSHPCIKCGESDIVVLEFDHKDPELKSHNIANMLHNSSWARILSEIEKCDVLCANDHRRRTTEQFGWYRGL